jgi:predicted nucleotidyltransferase
MKQLENKIENELFDIYRTSFSVSFLGEKIEVTPNNFEKLADNLEVENDSDEFWYQLEKIREKVNARYSVI